MIHGKTTSGYEFDVDERMLKDMRFVRVFREWQKNNFAQADVLDCMLGKDGAAKLEEHLADKDGYVDSGKIADEMGEILEIIQEKNSKIKN